MTKTSSKFNLDAPPGFRGFDEHLPVTTYHRKLPHWRQNGATYAVTFRLNDALPQKQLDMLKRLRQRWEIQHPEPRTEADWQRYALQVSYQTERWLDEGYGTCYFRQPRFAKMMSEALTFYQEKCLVSCFTVMPNHIHAVMRPVEDHRLETVLKMMKGYVSRQINKTLKRSGGIWLPESYDWIVRDEEHLYRIVQYFGRNGSQAGLADGEYVRWVSPIWVDAGWGFVDA